MNLSLLLSYVNVKKALIEIITTTVKPLLDANEKRIIMATVAEFKAVKDRLVTLEESLQTYANSLNATIAALRDKITAGGLTADEEAAQLADLNSIADQFAAILPKTDPPPPPAA